MNDEVVVDVIDPFTWSLDEEDIVWTMDWTPREQYPDKPAQEEMFENENGLAFLLMNEIIFLNQHWWEKDWPEDAKKTTALCVNCNDVFAWACADAEQITLGEIKDLYKYFRKDPMWGAAVWCMIKRNQMPQKPVELSIRAAGIWDLDSLGIAPNTQDAETQSLFQYVVAKAKGLIA